jgi:hypothetical protein
MGQVVVKFAYETLALAECDRCSHLHSCYSSSTVFNIHIHTVTPMLQRNLDRQRRFCVGPSDQQSMQVSGVSMKVTGATKPTDSNEDAGVW